VDDVRHEQHEAQARTAERPHGCRCVSDTLVDSAWLGAPKVFGCATESSVSPARPFVFRTYEFPPGPEAAGRAASLALHAGSSKHRVWQAVRASSAAPYYLDDFNVGDLRFQDGAVTVNNPAVRPEPHICSHFAVCAHTAALTSTMQHACNGRGLGAGRALQASANVHARVQVVAVQEARMLYPGVPLDAVVSLGVGVVPDAPRPRGMSSYFEAGSSVVESATGVGRAHEALAATLDMAGCTYERCACARVLRLRACVLSCGVCPQMKVLVILHLCSCS
jgi:hypothetical protein